MKLVNQPKKVIIIGAGLSGLTAASQLLKASPTTHVTVLQALDRVGGRTNTVNINGFNFDEGAEFIGLSQKYIIELAKQSGNELVEVFHSGTKIIEMQNKIFKYESDIPNNLSIWGLINFQILILKINRMANKVSTLNPKACQLGYYWDSLSVQTWINSNISNQRIKIMVQIACRSIFGAEPCQMSFLYFLWYIRQNKSLDNLININNGLQQMKTKLGTQHFSKYLSQKILEKNGKIVLNVKVKQIQQREGICIITDSNNKKYECDYLIMACSPWQANRMQFLPKLSLDRKLLCSRSFMGSYIKVILLYKKAYWKEKGWSGQILTDCRDSPLMTAFDDTKTNQKGETQPALIVFVAGHPYRLWKERNDFQKTLVNKFAQIVGEPQMLHPIKVQWRAWEDEETIGGGPTGIFGPGVLSQVEDLRAPQGLIHWAGTELASVSTGYMDGAIESGIRAARQIDERMKGVRELRSEEKEKSYWYTKYLRRISKWIQWW